MKISDYISIFNQAMEESGDRDLAIVILQEIGKDLRMQQIPKNTVNTSPATDKQIELLKKMKITIPKNLTKLEAIQLIKEKLS